MATAIEHTVAHGAHQAHRTGTIHTVHVAQGQQLAQLVGGINIGLVNAPARRAKYTDSCSLIFHGCKGTAFNLSSKSKSS